MAKAIWRGSISFGLVNIPVKLYVASRDKDIHFHQLRAKDGSRVKYRTVSAADEKDVPREEIVKGFEIAKDQYVIIRGEELDALAPEKSQRIDIVQFVDLHQIDPLYYDKPYYLVPEHNAEKAYRLLVDAMSRADKVGIARFVMRNKEYLAALRPLEGALCLETMRFPDEVVLPQSLEGLPANVKVSAPELKMAQQLIDALSGDFDPQQYRDEYRQRVQELIDKKAKGEEVIMQAPPAQEPRVIDLMAALERSLQQARNKEAPARLPAAGGRKRRKVA